MFAELADNAVRLVEHNQVGHGGIPLKIKVFFRQAFSYKHLFNDGNKTLHKPNQIRVHSLL